MFSSLKLFAQIPCPLAAKCELSHCGFSHDQETGKYEGVVGNIAVPTEKGAPCHSSEPAAKRRKVEATAPALRNAKASSQDASLTVSIEEKAREGKSLQTPPVATAAPSRPISPPPTKRKLESDGKLLSAVNPKRPAFSGIRLPTVSGSSKPSRPGKSVKKEPLLPRTLKSSPATFPVRLQLLKLLHAELLRLNDEIKKSKDPDRDAMLLSEDELIIESLNEEERAAKENPVVYTNVLKNRIMTFKRMKLDGWREERRKHIARDTPTTAKSSASHAKRLNTGLSPEEEIAILPNLLTPIRELSDHGYVPHPPPAADIEQARAEVLAAKSFEKCERCDSRFQVFPGRREDGVLMTNGPCSYHWGRKRRPRRQPGDGGTKEDQWTCCNGEMASKGCTRAESHVFKISDPKRLALVLPFEETRRKGPSPPGSAVAFDCEMGHTSLGMELIRLTATAWPSGDELVDVLVRPMGEILDLNTRFSGVKADDFANAVPYDASQHEAKGSGPEATPTPKPQESGTASDNLGQPSLKIVDSPARARELLMEHLTTATPLIGHAIDNDLNAVRLCHPAIIDTVLLFPHPLGLPYRHGLRALAKQHLELDIQTGGEAGHDSKEDARATGELVRYKVLQRWREMRNEGWKIDGGVFIPPTKRR